MATNLGSIEVRICDEDRERYGGAEWVRLDLDKLWSTPSVQLERWEAEIGDRSIGAACALVSLKSGPPAWAKRAVVWLARKQSGDNRNNPAGTAEPFSALAELKTMQVRIRDWVDPNAPAEPVEAEDDVDPPDPNTSDPATPPS